MGDCSGYAWPDHTKMGKSICYHVQQYYKARENMVQPADEERRFAVDALEDKIGFRRVSRGGSYDVERFMADLREIDPNSSPGLPWINEGTSKNSAFWFEGKPGPRALDLYAAVLERLNALETRPAMDPIKVFVKEEPVKPSKVEKESYRLISGVSITDCMVDRYLFGDFCKHVQSCTKDLSGPAVPGWTHSYGAYKLMKRSLREPQCADKSSWDWTMQPWVVDCLLELVNRFYCDEDVRLLNRFKSLFDCAVYDIGGNLYRQRSGGVMKSGCLGTLVFNSLAQVFIHQIAVMRSGVADAKIFANGDDTIQERMPDCYYDEVSKLGCILKEVQLGYEFCGVEFGDEPKPLYGRKNLYNLLYLADDSVAEALRSYQLMYVCTDAFTPLQKMGLVKGVGISRNRALSWLEGYE